ncbi:MAG: hypothetical protein R8P61_30775 [Bacteroidia bacterium]|nr:hypothetical protein [Bacteroidia bacterium]
MKVIITKQHIKAAKLSEGRITPIEVALNDMDCFQEISLKEQEETGNFLLELDGMKMDLPKKASTQLRNFMETGEMKAFNFDLPMEEEIFVGEDLLMESFEDSLHMDMDLDFF